MKTIKILAGAATLVLFGWQAQSQTPLETSTSSDARFMREFKTTTPPRGYVEFCRSHPRDCAAARTRPVLMKMSRSRWNELNAINSNVNHVVQPTTDLQLHGRNEVWSYPKDYGDCEDYVLLKRKQLIQKGWPKNTLLITVLRDENNDGHAVLTVVTDMGDLILDNKVGLIRPWSDTPYTYYLRQSRSDPRKWVNLSTTDLGTRPTATIAGR